MNEGWIKLHRKILDSPLWKDCNDSQRVVLITILLMASHKENRWIFKGQEYSVKPGQFVTSLKSISEQSGVNVGVVQRCLSKFEKYGFSISESTNKNRLITIENWDKYQGGDDDIDKATDKQPISNRQATDKQPITIKNERMKEGKNERQLQPDFVERFNEACPSLPKLVEMTPQRTKALTDLVSKYGSEAVETAFEKAEQSDFLTGRNGRLKIQKSFDWIIQPSNFLKIMEGFYDNKGAALTNVKESDEELSMLFRKRETQ